MNVFSFWKCGVGKYLYKSSFYINIDVFYREEAEGWIQVWSEAVEFAPATEPFDPFLMNIINDLVIITYTFIKLLRVETIPRFQFIATVKNDVRPASYG